METITVNVFNLTHTDNKNYITSIEMPNYKQIGRIINYLRDYVKKQGTNDFKHQQMRFYVFQSESFVIKECDLTI